jgi:GNAT superfamily N-acetyltransferase
LALRPFLPSDLDSLVDCWYETWHASFAPRRHPDPIRLWRRRVLQYAEDAEIWLARDPAQVAAFMILFPETAWLEQLFVRPRFQGQGLGRALIALARFRCPAGLELDTPAENAHARDFYRRRGFTARQAAFDPIIERLILRYAWEPVGLRLPPHVTAPNSSSPASVNPAPHSTDRDRY